MEIINLNLIPTGTRPVVHASQYDNGRQFRANLFEGASVYTLTGAETLTFSVRKPDGHIVTEAVTNTSDNYVVIETTTQMCACAGDSFAELKIENGDDLIGTLNLILAVEQSPEEGGDPSESFIHNLEEQIYDAVADQYDSNNVIFDNAPTSGHGTPYTVTSEGIKTAIDNGTITLKTIDNVAIASFSDGADSVPVKNLEVDIQYQQASGTPTPSDPLPITAFSEMNVTRCGINLVEETINNASILNDGTIYSSGNNFDMQIAKVKQGITYILTSDELFVGGFFTSKPTMGSVSYNNARLVDQPKIFTAPITGYVAFRTAINYATPQLEIGNQATPYKAYNGQTYNISFGQTVGKGTLNVTTGELTITHGVLDLGDLTWTKENNHFYSNIVTTAKGVDSNSQKGDIVCENYLTESYNVVTQEQTDNTIAISKNKRIYVYDSVLSSGDAIAFTTAVNGVCLVYKLATPTVVQLSPTEVKTLLGNNNIFADTGDINTLTYYVDTNALNLVTGLVDKYGVQSDWNEADSTKADYIQNKPTIPTNGDFSLSGLSDTDISGETSGQILAYDGANWANTNPIVVKYEEINVAFDSSGEGTLYNNDTKFVVGVKDIPSDSLYIGYVVVLSGTKTLVKGFSRSATSFDSTAIASTTRKVGVYYLNNITTT